MILAVLLSLLIGLTLGLLGGGGSILTVPILVYALHVPAKEAIATSLLVVGITSLVAMVQHAWKGSVSWRVGVIFGAAGMVGAFLGGWVARYIPSVLLLVGFALIMFATAWAMLRNGQNSRKPKREEGECLDCMAWGEIILHGLVVGAVTGLVGAGGGFLVVPALTLLGGLPMHLAIGTSLLVIFLKSMAGFIGYLSHVSVDYTLAGVVTGSAVVGSFLGSWLAHRIAAKHLRKTFAWFVIGMAIYILFQQWEDFLPALTDLIDHLMDWVDQFKANI
ncbi:sulfite exporter TauE/SafE family protein [Methylohalobius crimeensis]|uniref:sulfite exporter TauE/SafE family protein n=1 Tax=Methylohalobius crimeensis TaxID=244365 RepID=UPI0003B3E7C0|nr:sulfite exporter TauE/SafE family protein [Methylohalobius crimeensis]